MILRYRHGSGEWRDLETGEGAGQRETRSSPGGQEHGMTLAGDRDSDPRGRRRLPRRGFGAALGRDGTEPSDQALEIGDLAIPLPVNLNREQEGKEWVSIPLLKHGLVSGGLLPENESS